MFDLWGFLLQTLTASGVAVLLLLLKALFRDKLPPKWHFAVWGVLGVMLLVPAGWNGRYTLVHWQLVIESLKIGVGDYSISRVLFPIPVITAFPDSAAEWLFAGYAFGVAVQLLRYFVSYLRLRRVLAKGRPVSGELHGRICAAAAALGVKPCRVTEVQGLPSAFVCGIFRPVLVLPAAEELDDKVILHELMHLKARDTVWSVVICVFRCLHWCNPLLVYCAACAANDLETRCDQYVLEHLDGEERRAYGHILLSMVNEKFAKTPGTTCVNNGGRQIGTRIEAISRFKRYPAGMGLVSVCVLVLLVCSLVTGVQAATVYKSRTYPLTLSMASARSVRCTTPAGAFDTYAKAILDRSGIYRVMCAPAEAQADLISEMKETEQAGAYPMWESGLEAWPDAQSGYFIYNLSRCSKDVYEGLLVLRVNRDFDAEDFGKMAMAAQDIRVVNENGRWVAEPLCDFQQFVVEEQSLQWGCMELPGVLYTGVTDDFQLEVNVQTVYIVDNAVQDKNDPVFFIGSHTAYDMTPKPNARFSAAARTLSNGARHLGTQAERDVLEGVGLSLAPVYPGEERPENLTAPGAYGSGGGSNSGESWGSQRTDPGWGPYMELGGGSGGSIDPEKEVVFPSYFAADFYLDGELAGQLDLRPEKGAAP